MSLTMNRQSTLVMALLATLGLSAGASADEEEIYDIVINGGRVMDPETMFDAVRNVGVSDGRIATITSGKIKGREVINASGLVVAPGFIDTHFHGQDTFATKLALRDGVTSGLDLEEGATSIDDWYLAKKDRWQINYGVTVGHGFVRMIEHDPEVLIDRPVDASVSGSYLEKTKEDGIAGWTLTRSNTEQLNNISRRIDEELRQGALGVGVLLGYMSKGVSSYEMFEVQRAAARYGRLASVHTRYHIDANTPTEAPIAFDEIFTNAMLLKAPLLMAHNNDYGWEEITEKLQLARAQGLNMWSEYYPYEAGSTFISAEFLQPAVWEEKLGYKYEETIYNPQTDRYLNKEDYQALVDRNPAQAVVVYLPKRRKWLPYWLMVPHMTLASDSMPGVGVDGEFLPWDADFSAYAGHPRTAGSRTKVLRLGRELGVPLMHTLAQLSYWSAKHLGDAGLVSMQERGRLQEGRVADITIFDPKVVSDQAGYKSGTNGLPSVGIPWVIVNGTVVVENAKVQKGVTPGQAIRYPVEREGRFKPVSREQWVRDFTIRSKPLESGAEFSHLR